MRYRCRPEIVTALPWFELDSKSTHPDVEIVGWCGDRAIAKLKLTGENVEEGDYIITHEDGSVSVMAEEEFFKHYEEEDEVCPCCRGEGKVKI